MNNVNTIRPTVDDLDQYEEIAIATAQSEMECMIAKSGMQRSEVAEIMGRPRSFISKIMNGGHNLTIRTMARLFAACGHELRFNRVSVVPHWQDVTVSEDAGEIIATPPSCEARAGTIPVVHAGASHEDQVRLAA